MRIRSSSQKGGTLIVEGVTSREAHERMLMSPDGYRPVECPRCQFPKLHVHDYRERKLRGDVGTPFTRIVRYDCYKCDAIWQTLPEFLARQLWRSWPVVEKAVMGTSMSIDENAKDWPQIPDSTRRRWQKRWRSSARFIVQIFAACGSAVWSAFCIMLGNDATRGEWVLGYASHQKRKPGQRLSAVAAQIDRFERGVRLM